MTYIAKAARHEFKGPAGGQRLIVDQFGALDFMQHTKYREDWDQLPALKATLDTYTSSVAAAEAVATNKANKNWEVLFSDVTTTGSIAWDVNNGGAKLTTSTGDASQAIIRPQTSTDQTSRNVAQFLSQNQPWMKFRIKTGASIALTRITAGLKLNVGANADVPATDDNQMIIRYTATLGTGDLTTTNFQLVTSRANVDVFFDTGVPVVINTNYTFYMGLDSTLKPFLYCGAQDATSGLLSVRKLDLGSSAGAAMVTAISYKPCFVVNARGTTPGAKSLTVLPGMEVGHFSA